MKLSSNNKLVKENWYVYHRGLRVAKFENKEDAIKFMEDCNATNKD